jgi:hypothetical protein
MIAAVPTKKRRITGGQSEVGAALKPRQAFQYDKPLFFKNVYRG